MQEMVGLSDTGDDVRRGGASESGVFGICIPTAMCHCYSCCEDPANNS